MNKVVGFQITARDEELLNNFYSDSFGWRLSPGPHEHVTNLDTGNPTLEGSMIGRGEHIPDYVSLFIETDNLDDTINKAVENGGQLIRPAFSPGNGDTLAIIADPEGHVITLIHKTE